MKTTTLFKINSIAFLCCMFSFAGIAQVKESNPKSNHPALEHKNDPFTFPAEKIYLQLDNKIYTTDQTVWFKAIVTRASDHTSSGISGVLHVDLIDQNELIVEKKLIRLVGGIGDGFFQLNSNYPDGHYQIRAYTEWNRNFGPDFFFKEYIRVYSDGTVVEPNPIQSLTLTGTGNERRIKATINPSVIDSMHTRDLTLFIAADDQHDTLNISRSGKNNYELDYAVPQGANFITLKLNTKNASGYSRTVVMDENFLDLQFFPESGEMVHGVPNVLGFKALDSSGNGIKVAGEILYGKDQVICTFESNELGMGSVLLAEVDSSERYTARLTGLKDKTQVRYPLPAAVSKGNLLTVRKMRERIYLKATSNYLIGDSLVVKASCRGQAHFDFKGRLREGTWEFMVPGDMLPEGVISFTLMNLARTPLAERLYFNDLPDDRIRLSVNADKAAYTQRELTKLDINTTDINGKPIDAGLSVMVLNSSDVGNSQSLRENILSYFLLSSDLRGRIENPGSYFTDKLSRHEDLDALLLTQGWRKYKYSKPPGAMTFKPEQTIAVSGYVGAALAQKKERAGVPLIMMIFGSMPGAQTQTTDSLGRFSFDLDEQEGHSVDVLVQSNGKTGKQKDYTVIFDKQSSPLASFDPILTIQKPDSIERAYVSKSMDRKKADDAYIRSVEGIALQEVVVRETALSPEKKRVEDKYGKARRVISGDDIRSKEPKWAYGLYSVLMFKFPEIRVRQYPSGLLFASIPNGELTLVVVDGMPVFWEEYRTISSIPPSEVKSFELIPYAKNFRSLFCETFPPEACGFNTPTVGNVIAIYTYAGKGIYGVRPPVGLSRHSVPVYAAPREFYAPKYEHLTQDDWKKSDKRTLVHWQPQLWTDKLGNASLSFYNADNIGPQSVVVEAISSDGRIGYKEIRVNVTKKEN